MPKLFHLEDVVPKDELPTEEHYGYSDLAPRHTELLLQYGSKKGRKLFFNGEPVVRGDLIRTEYSYYRNDNLTIWDGKKCVPLNTDFNVDEYGSLPREFVAFKKDNFVPTSFNEIQHNDFFWMDVAQFADQIEATRSKRSLLETDEETFEVITSSISHKGVTYRVKFFVRPYSPIHFKDIGVVRAHYNGVHRLNHIEIDDEENFKDDDIVIILTQSIAFY